MAEIGNSICKPVQDNIDTKLDEILKILDELSDSYQRAENRFHKVVSPPCPVPQCDGGDQPGTRSELYYQLCHLQSRLISLNGSIVDMADRCEL